MARVMVFLADGFEEIEGLTVVDQLRRAGSEVVTVSVMGRKEIRGSHEIQIQADELFEDMEFARGDVLVLPGGMPGTLHLGSHRGLGALLEKWNEMGERIAAICAAPSVLGDLGILEGEASGLSVGVTVDVDMAALYSAACVLGCVDLPVDKQAASHGNYPRVYGYSAAGGGDGAGAGAPAPTGAAASAGAVSGNAEISQVLDRGDALQKPALPVCSGDVVGE